MSQPSQDLLSVRGVAHKYAGLTVLTDVSFDISSSELVSLIGPNGAGKTTLFNIVSGLTRPAGGEVLINGHSLAKIPPHNRALLGIARTFQHPKLFDNLSVLENVCVGSFLRAADVDTAMERSLKWLRRVQLADFADAPVSRLTLLQRKFLEMARALASEPSLLLLDEVMTGLNPTEIHDAVALVRSVRDEGITILLVEHVMEAVMRVSDRVLVLAEGRIIASGSPEQVARDPLVLRAYLGDPGRSDMPVDESVAEV